MDFPDLAMIAENQNHPSYSNKLTVIYYLTT